MCAVNSAPYSKSNSSWPDFSTGIESRIPISVAFSATSVPNCSSTRMPAADRSAPASSAASIPSNTTFFASMIRAASSGPGMPSIPKNFFWNDPRWSNARM